MKKKQKDPQELPALLSIEGKPLAVGDTVYLVARQQYHEPEHPSVATVTQIDLKARTARIQIKDRGEMTYYADLARQEKFTAGKLFSTVAAARAATLPAFEDKLRRANKEANEHVEARNKAKAKYSAACAWRP